MSELKNELIYNKDFLKDIRRIPAELRQKLSELMEIFSEDPFDPRLHTKPLAAPLQGLFSFRITRDYRVGFRFSSAHVIQLLIADNRSNIYRRLHRKS